MTATTRSVYEVLMSGEAGAFVQSFIDSVSQQERRDLLCALCCTQKELAVNSADRAEAIGGVLSHNGCGVLPDCRLYQLSAGWCPLLCNSPLVLPELNQQSI